MTRSSEPINTYKVKAKVSFTITDGAKLIKGIRNKFLGFDALPNESQIFERMKKHSIDSIAKEFPFNGFVTVNIDSYTIETIKNGQY